MNKNKRRRRFAVTGKTFVNWTRSHAKISSNSNRYFRLDLPAVTGRLLSKKAIAQKRAGICRHDGEFHRNKRIILFTPAAEQLSDVV